MFRNLLVAFAAAACFATAANAELQPTVVISEGSDVGAVSKIKISTSGDD